MERPEALIADLSAARDEFLRALAGLSDDDLFRRPAPTEWSTWEICYHVATGEMWFIAKLCEAASTEKSAAAQRLMAVWSKLRDEAIALAREIPAERWHERGLLTGIPDWTPAYLLARHAGHDREHAQQALEARAVQPASTDR